jgi:hypothetical protein
MGDYDCGLEIWSPYFRIFYYLHGDWVGANFLFFVRFSQLGWVKVIKK